MDVDVSVLIVSWNVRDLLRDCLHSIVCDAKPSVVSRAYTIEGLTVEIRVLDNASADGSADMVATEFPGVHLVASEENLGFSAGNNVLLADCRGRYALLLNPDTVVQRGAILALVAYADAHPKVAVVGPHLVYGDGSPQSSRRRFPTLAMALTESTVVEQWFPEHRLARRYRMDDVPADRAHEVDWVVGACMLVRRQAWEQVGLLDEAYFMYSEELDWCKRMANAGWDTAYVPDALVVHYEGRSSAQVVPERHIRFQRSKIRYFFKHHGRWQAGVLRGFLLCSYAWQLTIEAAKLAVGHKPSLRQHRIRAYARVLQSRLLLGSTEAVSERSAHV